MKIPTPGILLFILTIFFTSVVFSQDTLPKFSVKNAGNGRNIISWTNNYQLVKQISIQRSNDSLKNFKTIMTVPDPMNKQNGFTDTKAVGVPVFYRLFLMLDNSMFIFSDSKRPFYDTARKTVIVVPEIKTKKPEIIPAKPDSIYDSVTHVMRVNPFNIDINKPGSRGIDSATGINVDNRKKPDIFIPSMYVYSSSDGNIHLNLPDVLTKKYSIKFYDENEKFLFELKDLKETPLIIDKTNFYHAGWFKFELSINGKLKEKNKFYLEKEF